MLLMMEKKHFVEKKTMMEKWLMDHIDEIVVFVFVSRFIDIFR
jgi:hypothetical protein